MAAASWAFRRPIRDAAHARREVESRIQTHVHQTLSSMSIVQAFAREDNEQQRFQELASAAIRAHQRGAFVGAAYALGSGLVTTIGTAIIMCAAAMRVLDGRLTIGTALVFLAYLTTLQWQFSAFATMFTALQTAGAGVDRVMEVLDARRIGARAAGRPGAAGAARRGHLRGRGLRLPAGSTGAARRQLHGRGRGDHRGGRARPAPARARWSA